MALLKGMVIGSLKSALKSQRCAMFSTITNFDELLIELKGAEDSQRIRTLLSRALEYESANIHEVAYETAHLASYRLKNWEESLRLLKDMEKRNFVPSARAYSLTARACAGRNQWEEAANVVRKAWQNKINVDPQCITSVLTACQDTSHETQGAEKRIAICYEFLDNTPPELHSKLMVRAAMKCICESGTWSEGYKFLKKLEFDHEKSRTSIALITAYTSLMYHSTKHKETVEKTLELFDEARAHGYRFNEWGYDAAMNAAMQLNKPTLAIDLFLELEESGAAPSALLARRALSAVNVLDDSRHNELLLPYLLDYARPDLTLDSLSTLCKVYAADDRDDDALEVLEKYILSVLPQSENQCSGDEYAWCDDQWAKDRVPLICDHAFNVLMSLEDLNKALALVEAMGKEMHPAVPYRLISLCRHQKLNSSDYMLVMSTCLEAGLQPNANAIAYAITQCKKERKYEDIVKLFNMKSPDHLLSLVAYNTVIDALGQVGNWQRAVELVYELGQCGVNPDVRTFNAALNACSQASEWRSAKDLLNVLRATDLKPDELSYSMVMNACKKAGRFLHAMQVFEAMKKDGLNANVVHYNILIGTAGAQGFSHKVSELIAAMEAANIEPDATTFNSTLRAYGTKGEKMDKAIAVFCDMMPRYGAPVDAQTLDSLLHALHFTSALNALTMISVWFNQLDPSLRLNLHESSSSELRISEKWPKVIDILGDAVEQGGMRPSLGTFKLAVKSCEQVEWQCLDNENFDRGRFEGGRSARVLVELMSKFGLEPTKYILDTCLKTLCDQLRNDRKQGKNESSRPEILQMVFSTVEDIKRCRDFDPKFDSVRLETQLNKAVQGGAVELTAITKQIQKRKGERRKFKK